MKLYNKKFLLPIFALSLVCGGFGGFFIGRKTIETKDVVRYIHDDPLFGTVSEITPVRETVPEEPKFPLLKDTLYLDNIVYVQNEIDTAAIINDYILKREYAPVLFDNPKLGKLSLSATVQYNKLDALSYEFIPMYKEVTKYKVEVWQPFVAISYSTLFQIAGFGGGVFYKKIGLEYQYQYSLFEKRIGHQFGLKWKF